MPNSKPTKSHIKTIELRVATFRAEMNDPYTISLGAAAVNCVRESLEVWEAELARLQAA